MTAARTSRRVVAIAGSRIGEPKGRVDGLGVMNGRGPRPRKPEHVSFSSGKRYRGGSDLVVSDRAGSIQRRRDDVALEGGLGVYAGCVCTGPGRGSDPPPGPNQVKEVRCFYPSSSV